MSHCYAYEKTKLHFCFFAIFGKKLIMNANQIEFVTYCIGNLATRLNLSQCEVYNRLKSSGILSNYIIPGFDVLHTFDKESLMDDLIGYMHEKKVV